MSESKNLPFHVTSYDLLKTLAVMLMIIDHIGYYFYPDNDWWRVIGRMSAPIWLFLVGYALSRDFSSKLWIGAVILAIVNLFTGPALFPLNILFTILFVRWILDKAAHYMTQTLERLLVVSVLISTFMIPSYFLLEYGLHGIQIAVFGWAVRHYQDGLSEKATSVNVFLLIVFALAAYLVNEVIVFGFDHIETASLVVLVSGVFLLLYRFKPGEFPGIDQPFKAMLQFGGRRTLEIYVVHILLFKAVALSLGLPSVQFLEMKLFLF